MDSDFSEKLKAVLSDPEAMAKITAIASGLNQQGPSQEAPEQIIQDSPEQKNSESASSSLPAIIQGFSPQSDPRLGLLYSLKPLLREDKRGKIDSLTRALTIASLMKQFRK